MYKKIFLLLVVALMVTAAGCFNSNNNSNSSSTTNTVTNTNPSNTNEVGAGSFSTGSSNTNTATSNVNASAPAVVIVTVTSSGVSNRTITIAAGTTVTFNNADSVSHQIASDPHPVHTDLSGFDGLIPAGGSYSFTFTKTGTFGFHDHLNASNTSFSGSVVVQ